MAPRLYEGEWLEKVEKQKRMLIKRKPVCREVIEHGDKEDKKKVRKLRKGVGKRVSICPPRITFFVDAQAQR